MMGTTDLYNLLLDRTEEFEALLFKKDKRAKNKIRKVIEIAQQIEGKL